MRLDAQIERQSFLASLLHNVLLLLRTKQRRGGLRMSRSTADRDYSIIRGEGANQQHTIPLQFLLVSSELVPDQDPRLVK